MKESKTKANQTKGDNTMNDCSKNNEYVGKSLADIETIRAQLLAEREVLAETSQDHDYYAKEEAKLNFAAGIAIATHNIR